MIPDRCQCGHFPVMHAGGRGKCNHGSHSPKTKTAAAQTGCDCTGFRAQTVIDTNDIAFAASAVQDVWPPSDAFLGVVNDASEDYE